METVVFGAGCFWCIQSVVDKWQGIISSNVGYSGGHIINPTYGNLCLGNSGHTEVIEINFNPNIISLKELIGKFFEIHDYTKQRDGASHKFMINPRGVTVVRLKENEIGKNQKNSNIEVQIWRNKPLLAIILILGILIIGLF